MFLLSSHVILKKQQRPPKPHHTKNTMDKKAGLKLIADLMEINQDDPDKTKHTRKQVVDLLHEDHSIPIPTGYKWFKSWEKDTKWEDPEHKKTNQALLDKNLVLSSLRHLFCQAEANEDAEAIRTIGKDLITAHKTSRSF